MAPAKTILVVDDEQMIREAVASYLERKGFRVLAKRITAPSSRRPRSPEKFQRAMTEYALCPRAIPRS